MRSTKERVSVGLSLARAANKAADAVSAVTGLRKCEVVERGIEMVVAGLPAPQRAAVEAVRNASEGGRTP